MKTKKEQLKKLKELLHVLQAQGVYTDMIITTKKGSDKFHFLQDNLFSIDQIAFGGYKDIKNHFEKELLKTNKKLTNKRAA